MSVVCCQVEVSATGRSLTQGSRSDCGVSVHVIHEPRAWGGPGPRWAVAPETRSCSFRGRDKVVGMSIRYVLDDQEFETRCWRYFLQPSRPAPRPTHPPVQWAWKPFSRGLSGQGMEFTTQPVYRWVWRKNVAIFPLPVSAFVAR